MGQEISRPILFSGPMVRALLDGRKTQTRRVVKWRGGLDMIGPAGSEDDPASWGFEDGETGIWWTLERGCNGTGPGDTHSMPCPYGEPGDRLWVRETFGWVCGNGRRIVYRADADQPPRIGYPEDPITDMKWTPSIYMRRQHSRITLVVTSVRVERVADINDVDAEAEGIEPSPNGHPAHIRFAELWDSINGKRPGCSWDANPWVWVVGFEVHRG